MAQVLWLAADTLRDSEDNSISHGSLVCALVRLGDQNGRSLLARRLAELVLVDHDGLRGHFGCRSHLLKAARNILDSPAIRHIIVQTT